MPSRLAVRIKMAEVAIRGKNLRPVGPMTSSIRSLIPPRITSNTCCILPGYMLSFRVARKESRARNSIITHIYVT